MVDSDFPNNDEKPPIRREKPLIRRGRVDSVNIYEVKEHELEILEKGTAGTLQFNFAIFLFSTAITCIVALLTSNFKWQTVRVIFILISIVGILQGSYLIISWWRSKKPIRELVTTIRSRINGQVTNIQIPEEPETQSKIPKDNEESNDSM